MQTNVKKQAFFPRDKAILPKTFKASAWLGWQIETNWANPFVLVVYAIVKPVSAAAILVVMYSVITNGAFENAVFPYIYLGNAFYIYVGAVMGGLSWAVIDDREHYRMLKYIYVAPIHFPTYLIGRGVSRFIFGSLSVFITILFGVLFLKVPLVLAEVNWLLFFVSLGLGIVMLISLGLVLASFSLIIANHVWFLGEGVASALYLFSGAIFPLEVLPVWLRPVGYAMPLTYWLELMRRSLIGNIAEAFPTLGRFSNLELIGILVGLTVVFNLIAFFAFRWCDHRACELGYIDMTTNY